MIRIPRRVLDRMRVKIKKYQKIASILRERDISEADTVTLVKDMLADIFGYDKYLELTGEYQVRGTYCDLAVKIEEKLTYLVEVKAAGVKLAGNHIRQAVGYAAKAGIEWVVLTNGLEWKLYRIKFAQPIEHEEVASFTLAEIDLRKEDDQRKIFLLSREAIKDGAMDTYHKQAKILNCYTMAQVVQLDPVVKIVRREFRRLFPEVKVDKEEVARMLVDQIIKRDIIESRKAKEASSKVRRAVNKIERKREKAKQEKEAAEATPPAKLGPAKPPPRPANWQPSGSTQ